MPKRSAQNVCWIGIPILPPSESAAKDALRLLAGLDVRC